MRSATGNTPEVPDWMKETPEECSYNLTMYGSSGDGIQQIDLSRGEYEALKRQLAADRGRSEVADQEPRGKTVGRPMSEEGASTKDTKAQERNRPTPSELRARVRPHAGVARRIIAATWHGKCYRQLAQEWPDCP
jgi:hypothetical protein